MGTWLAHRMDIETVRMRASLNVNTATIFEVEIVEGEGVFVFWLIEPDLKRDAAMVMSGKIINNAEIG